MVSLKRVQTALLLGCVVLLGITPLAAASKTRHNTTRVKAHSSVSTARVSSGPRNSSLKASSSVTSTGRHGHKTTLRSIKATKPKARGQQSIDSARTMEIQQALIREHYLQGEATGEWDQATRDALMRFQGDNHWQTKILPDSRALIKLGLGPSQQNLLNPESAAIAPSYQAGVEKTSPGGSN